MSMNVPHFPRELEQGIFEIAAETWSHEVPKLLRVAHRVHVWLEPFLYRTIHLGFPHPGREKDAQEAFLSAAACKPASFLARAVRRVFIDFSFADFTPEILLRVTEALRPCTGITHFAMNKGKDMTPADIFDALNRVHLHCLGGFLRDVMPAPIPMDALQPIFRSLTHLLVFDKDLETDPGYLPFVMTLPALTHLALKHWIWATVWTPLLQRDVCVHLRILVFLIKMAADPPLRVYEEQANAVGRLARDPRVVGTVYEAFPDCISVQGHTFWDEAEIFIQKKKSGLIPNDCYWTGDYYAARYSHLSGTIL
ncbi:hypothetical protein C8F01DRAFT_1231969 [Mycena amicta]|nr:hypothetical protein C8F01DRAFT_1231969 [Mycena amicta]